MPEVIIKYKSKRTLEALKDFAKYFDFSIITLDKNEIIEDKINNVTIVPADNSINTSEMESIFSGKSIDSKILRHTAWQRSK